MTKDEAIKYGKEQLDVFGGKHANFIKSVIKLLEQPTINEIKVHPNLTNKGFIKKAFPNIDLDLNQEYKGYFLGYRNKTELRPILWFDENWLKEKYRKENDT